MKDIAKLSAEDVFKALDTSPDGLTNETAKKRLEEYGLNVLIEKKRGSTLGKFVHNLLDFFSLLLILAAVLAALSSMMQLSLLIFLIVLINAVFSLFQEWRAEQAMAKLKSWMPEYAKVIRDKTLCKIQVRDIVSGDVIVLDEGDRVPADARLIESYELWTNNVPLTGESAPQSRTAKIVTEELGSPLEAPNIVFMSTSVARGHGKAVVFATGMQSNFGKIAGLTQEIKDTESPLQKEIAHTARYDFALAIAVGVIFFLISTLWLGLNIFSSMLFMIGVMVALVPEGLQVTVSSALAINVLKMVKENVLIRRLSSVQTLGSVTEICTDKTGTITKGEMTATKIWLYNKVIDVSGIGYEPIGKFTSKGQTLETKDFISLERLIEICALCNTSKVEPPSDRNKTWNIIGDPTDGALLVAALKYGLDTQRILTNKLITDILPFNSERKRMTTVHKDGQRLVAYTKGAPRSILSISTKIAVNDHVESLVNEYLRQVEAKLHEFAEEGLRLIAVAFKELPGTISDSSESLESEMTLVGLVAMKDPPRPEVKEAVAVTKRAHIRTTIITGDYGPTAKAIAKEVGIVETDNCKVIRGVDLEKMSENELSTELDCQEVIFARVSPEQKLRIVRMLKKKGEVVAVTGDGVNDAPSLKEADIGVAMGLSGTDVAKEAADMVLLDDSYASIVKAVEAGRTIYDNIRKFIVYVFSHNWAELIPYILYIVLGIPFPLLVVQVLAIDLGIDVLPSLALSREPPEPGIMDEPPRSKKERLFNSRVLLRSLYIGIIIAAGAMLGCFRAWSAGGWTLGMQLDPNSLVYIKGVTMTFSGIVVAQMGNLLACRTSKASLFKTSWTSNKWIWLGMLWQISILSILVYLPPLQRAFGTTALEITDWIFLLTLAGIVVLAEEIRKFLTRRLTS